MALSAGFLSGVASGLEGGMRGVSEYQNMALKNKLYKAQLAEQGLQENDNGGLIQTPWKQAQMQAGQAANQAKLQELGYEQQPGGQWSPGALFQAKQQSAQSDAQRALALKSPNSPESQSARQMARNTIAQTYPGAEKSITDDMTGEQALSHPLYKNVGAELGYRGKLATANLMGQRLGLMQQRFGEQQSQNAAKAGKEIEQDPIHQQIKKTTNSLDRASQLLDGKEPITAKSFNILQQDFINATASGGAATEGKVNREMVETAQSALNNLQLKFGDVKDLRKEQPEVVNNLRNLISQVKSDYAKAQANRVQELSENYSTSTNPGVKEVISKKQKRYQAPEEEKKGLVNGTAGKPKVVNQGGHIYTLNPQTGEYE